MTGTTIAHAIPIAITPIITRVYTPQDFGIYFLFLSITLIIGSIANGKYELAIVLPVDDEDAINLFALGFIITTILSMSLFFVLLIIKTSVRDLLDIKEESYIILFIPFVVYIAGVFNLLKYLSIRLNKYHTLAKATVIKSIITGIFQIFIGLLKSGVLGLISGQLISQFIIDIYLVRNIMSRNTISVSVQNMFLIGKRYIDFPKYYLLAGLLNTSSINLTNICISIFYSQSILGYYSLVQRVLRIPATLVGNSVSDVFFKFATEEKHNTGTSIQTFKTTFQKLTGIAILIFPIIYFCIDDVIIFVFGKSWAEAGRYAKILTPLLCIRFIVSPLTRISYIYGKSKFVLIWQAGLLMLYFSSFLIAKHFNLSFACLLNILVLLIGSYYIFHLLVLYHYIKDETHNS